jgi:hypothetical protein
MKTTRFVLLLSAMFSMLLLAPSAHAAGAQCTLTAIEASKDGKGIDPELKEIKELTEPPLSATYTRFKFLGKAENLLEANVTKEMAPTKKHVAKLTFQGEEATSKKLQLKVELPELKFNADLKLKSGANFMIATKSGFLLAVKCSKTE